MKRLLAGAVVAGVAVFAGVGAFQDETVRDSTGAIIEGGGLGAFVIENGDCLNLPDGDLVESVEGRPCSQSHDAEVYGMFDMVQQTYPGASTIENVATDGCLTRFQHFVGVAYEYSELEIFWLEPTEESWDEIDDREIACMVVALDGSKLTGSMRGAAR